MRLIMSTYGINYEVDLFYLLGLSNVLIAIINHHYRMYRIMSQGVGRATKLQKTSIPITLTFLPF